HVSVPSRRLHAANKDIEVLRDTVCVVCGGIDLSEGNECVVEEPLFRGEIDVEPLLSEEVAEVVVRLPSVAPSVASSVVDECMEDEVAEAVVVAPVAAQDGSFVGLGGRT